MNNVFAMVPIIRTGARVKAFSWVMQGLYLQRPVGASNPALSWVTGEGRI